MHAAVNNGRVTKTTPKSSSKRTVKQEILDEDTFAGLPDIDATDMTFGSTANDEFFPLT